jgi:hypothetical protein
MDCLIKTKDNTATFVVYLLNSMIDKEIWPSNLKKQIIRLIYKKGNKQDYNNYRPIALLPVINKIIEKFFAQRINNYLSQFQLLYKNQYGYQTGKSTTDALHAINNKITKALDEGKYVGGILVDLEKAFDTLEKQALVEKLYKIGLRGKILNILQSYLSNRKFAVKIDDKISEWKDVKFGVPQGSILGPLLFLLYINDIGGINWTTNLTLYADDIFILSIHYNFKEMIKKLQLDFDKLNFWLHQNDLFVSKSKTNYILFTTSHMKEEKASIFINYKSGTKQQLINVTKSKYLGLNIDHRWKFYEHIENMITKIRQITPMLYKIKHYLSHKTKLCLFEAWIMSQLRYGCTIYGSTTESYINRLQKVQNKAVKVLFESNNVTTAQLYKRLEINNVNQMIELQIITQNYFSQLHKTPLLRPVRNSNVWLKTPLWRNSYGKRGQSFIIPNTFNKLPFNLRKLNSKKEVKCLIKKWIHNH